MFFTDSNVHQCSVLRQFMFLEYSAQGHQKNTVLNEIEAARKAITAPGNMWLHMAGNLEKHHLSAEPWAIFGKNGAKE